MKTNVLIPDGDQIDVTQANKKLYIEKFVEWTLELSIKRVFNSFRDGFFKVANKHLMYIFEPEELQTLFIGTTIEDFSILKEHCEYLEGYHPNHQTILNFWSIFDEFTKEEKLKFLKFLTGGDRLPYKMSGFRIRIRQTRGGIRYLPVAHTCVNMLDLPAYETKSRLRAKLALAMSETEGFGLV